MKHLAGCSIVLLAFCAVAEMANPCPPNDGSWIETGSIPNPAGTITFDDLGFSSAVGWNSASNPPILVYDANGRNASISNAGFLFNSVSQTTNGNRWNGQQNWFDGGGQPGYYWNLFGDATDHGELIFNVPVGMVTAKNIGSASTLDTARFEYYDENDNLIGCITNITENSGTNVRYRGVITTTPIKKIRIYSAQMLDEISFADAVCKADSCDVNARCFNAASNDGSVQCICKDGYEGDGFTCSDKNECDIDLCSPFANCTNYIGSYNCTCIDGYHGDGLTCEDNNECENDPCISLAMCINLPGTFNCTCKDGYEGDGFTNCTDINECDLGLCSPHATCVNYVPGFNCTCNAGYEGDGLTCTDKDECLTSPCSVNANCTNTDGSYTCACNTGYTGDGYTCTMVATLVAVKVSAGLLNSLSVLVLSVGVLLALFI